MRHRVGYRAGGACVLLASAALALAGCGAGVDDPAAGSVTAGEARALEGAAEMLKERRHTEQPTATASPNSDATAGAAER